MIFTYDVGSLPQDVEESTSEEGGERFREKAGRKFLDKLGVGIDVPNYPQLRDMNSMFLDMLEGLGRTKGGYYIQSKLTLNPEKKILPELAGIREVSKRNPEGEGLYKVKVCITGPYTLATTFLHKDAETIGGLGEALAEVAEANFFRDEHVEVALLCLDEPAFGLMDDPQLDYGAPEREALAKAWETILSRVKGKGVGTCMHLHATGDGLFWQVPSLEVVETHTEDNFYTSTQTREMLEKKDKFLKVSIAITDFDRLISKALDGGDLPPTLGASRDEKVGNIWAAIKRGQIDPRTFLEGSQLMERRLSRALQLFGSHRVRFAGPECGLRSFPNYETALECLRRVAEAVRNINLNQHRTDG